MNVTNFRVSLAVEYIFAFEILTFVEIEIDITTSGHQLKYDFYFLLIIYKSGLFQILGFSSYQKKKKKKKKKKLGMSDA